MSHYRPLTSIEIERAKVLNNLAVIRRIQPVLKVIPVLKSNAYGHGLLQMADILNDADVAMLAVDGYFEAAKIRDVTKHKVLVMGYILPQNLPLLDTKHCSFVVQDVATLKAFALLRRKVCIHLELNTGMNRLGLQEVELAPYLAVLNQYPHLELEGVMTHLADADNPGDDSFSRKQITEFDSQMQVINRAGFDPKYIHAFQTAGVAKVTSRYTNAFRLGIGLYGINPLTKADTQFSKLNSLQPILTMHTTVIKVINLAKRDRVSYNGIFTASKSMRIAVLPLGYYEGVPRALSNSGCFIYAGLRLPIVGRVCMNHTMVDISGTTLQVGDTVTVISNNPVEPNSIAKLQTEHGLFSYETVTALAETVHREIV